MGTVSTDIFNLVTDPFGPAAIAGVTIANRILLLTASAEIGMGRGYQPVCGYNFGAHKYYRVKRGYYLILIACSPAHFSFHPSINFCALSDSTL